MRHDKQLLVGPPSTTAMVSIFLKAIFSFTGISAVPAMRHEMIEPDKMLGCLTRAMAFVIFVYVAVSIPSLMAFGQPGLTLLGDVDLAFLYAGSAGILVNICITLPICLNVLFSGMGLTWLPLMQAKTFTSISIRFMLLLLALFVP